MAAARKGTETGLQGGRPYRPTAFAGLVPLTQKQTPSSVLSGEQGRPHTTMICPSVGAAPLTIVMALALSPELHIYILCRDISLGIGDRHAECIHARPA